MQNQITYLKDWKRDKTISNLIQASNQVKLIGNEELFAKLDKLIKQMQANNKRSTDNV